MKSAPLVSIIIPAYNKAALTCRTVDSVLAQTYSPLEIIVVDDGSTDNTSAAMAAYGPCINYVRKANGGACSARNEGIRRARGEYVALIDCDDLYVPTKIAESVRCLEDNPGAAFVHTAVDFIDGDDRTIGHYSHPESLETSPALPRLIVKNFVCNSTIVARKAMFDATGGFDERIFTPADWDMWLRLAEHADPVYIDKPLTRYRVIDNYTFNKIEQARREEQHVIDKFFDRNPGFKYLQPQVMGSWHLRFAQCYFLKNDRTAWKNELGHAFKHTPWNWKCWATAACAYAAPGILRQDLTRRIIRK